MPIFAINIRTAEASEDSLFPSIDEAHSWHRVSTGVISFDDANAYAVEIMEAFNVHVDREQKRDGLWKQFSARDQAQQIKSKIDRIIRALELAEEGRIEHDAVLESVLEEADDIINYAVFTKRIMKGLDNG